jgi:hypothetical protein
MTLRSLLGLLFCAALPLVLSGCGKGHPGLVPVTGTVTYRGQAVEGARVMFMAAEATSGNTPAANGKTDAQGRFSLMTFVPGDGAVPGNYRVLITKREEMPDPQQPKSPYKITRDLLPTRYGNPSRSGLKVEVKAGQTNDFEFKLTD